MKYLKTGEGHRTLIAMAVWIGILGGLAYWFELDARRESKQKAMAAAGAFFQQIVVTRQWNAQHGGVYVPVTSETQPNAYLSIQGRDLTADNGLKLTKINPSYMTRQIAELSANNGSGVQFHVTSLRPIRPENKAADWEEKWLQSFEQGAKEQGDFYTDGQSTWFRYMAPLIVTPECLQCHVQLGYQEGDIRGGISIAIPYPDLSHFPLAAGFGSVAVLGLLFIFSFGILYGRKHRLFDATFNSPMPTCVTDNNFTILLANNAYWDLFGERPDQRKTLKCHEHRPGASCHTENCPLTRIMGGSGKYVYESTKEIAGVSRDFIITAKPLLDAGDKVVGSVETFQEITERKRDEAALAASHRMLEALSLTDALTGIANRRRFDEVLAQEHARHARSGAELSLIMLDIDLFKSFNDQYGHVSGDQCLQKIAQAIAACANRPADLTARYGGEEFVCILPETDSSGAVAIAEKIRREIMALAIPHQESTVAACVTASLGVATMRCAPEGAAGDIIALADEQLYLAKAAGRNRVKFVATSDVGGKPQSNLVQLTWKDSFCCGNRLIDSQHQALFHASNGLLAAVLSARPAPEISSLIASLLAEIGQHFHDEEKILEAAGFPGLSQHVAEHAKLLAKGLELSEQFKASTLTLGELFQFLAAEVIMLHMVEADREYFPYISQTGAAAPEAGNNIKKQERRNDK